jgi:hypothetical protein
MLLGFHQKTNPVMDQQDLIVNLTESIKIYLNITYYLVHLLPQYVTFYPQVNFSEELFLNKKKEELFWRNKLNNFFLISSKVSTPHLFASSPKTRKDKTQSRACVPNCFLFSMFCV